METSKELLLKCKIQMGIKSDYALAKAMEIDSARIANYMAQTRIPDVYAAMKIAEILGRDPLEIIATIEAESAKSDKRRDFWNGFLLRARKQAAAALGVIMLVLSFGFTLAGGQSLGLGADRASGFGRRFKYA